MTPLEVVQDFVDRINAGDVQGLAERMTEAHRFVDSLGAVRAGRGTLRRAWEQYFRRVPDYRVEVHEAFDRGAVVALFGAARGTLARGGRLRAEDAWVTPAAWRAMIEGDLYADNEPIRRRMAARRE